ncbi:MAG: electron transfer flavoprotein subunit alpha/FixB family protein, partial [Elusimicrobiota bacterium]
MADNKGIWCVAETRHGKILPTAFELITAAKLIAAERGEPVAAVVVGGPGIAEAAAGLAECVEKVIVIEHD